MRNEIAFWVLLLSGLLLIVIGLLGIFTSAQEESKALKEIEEKSCKKQVLTISRSLVVGIISTMLFGIGLFLIDKGLKWLRGDEKLVNLFWMGMFWILFRW